MCPYHSSQEPRTVSQAEVRGPLEDIVMFNLSKVWCLSIQHAGLNTRPVTYLHNIVYV